MTAPALRTTGLRNLRSVDTEDDQPKTRRRHLAAKADISISSQSSDDKTTGETPRQLIQNMLSVQNTAQPVTRQQKRVSRSEISLRKTVARKTAVRHSVSATPDLEDVAKKYTPRTNIVGLLEQAPEETPVIRQAPALSESHAAPNVSTFLSEVGVSMIDDSFNSNNKSLINERGARFWGKRGRRNILPHQANTPSTPQPQDDTALTPQPETMTNQPQEEEDGLPEQLEENSHNLYKDKNKSNSQDSSSHMHANEAQSEERNVFSDVFGSIRDAVFQPSDKDLPGADIMTQSEEEAPISDSVNERHSQLDKTLDSVIKHSVSRNQEDGELSKPSNVSPSSILPTQMQSSLNNTPEQTESPRRFSGRIQAISARNVALNTLQQHKKTCTPPKKKNDELIKHQTLDESEADKSKESILAAMRSGSTKKLSPRTSRGSNLNHTKLSETGHREEKSRTPVATSSMRTMQTSGYSLKSVMPVDPSNDAQFSGMSVRDGSPLGTSGGSIEISASRPVLTTPSGKSIQKQVENQDPSLHEPNDLSASATETELPSADEYLSDVYSPLKTPKLKSKPDTPFTSTPAAERNTAHRTVLSGQKRKTASSSRPAKKCVNGLPTRIVKATFTHFCNLRLTKEALTEVEKSSEQYWQRMAEDLEAYAVHAHRKTINESDVELLMKRQGFITDSRSLNTLIATYLPLELRQELIPIARSGNKIEPKP